MGKIYTLFNPISANMHGEEKAEKIKQFFPNDTVEFLNITSKGV